MPPRAAAASSERKPLLGPALKQVAERHDQTLDLLGSELKELQLRNARLAPKLAEEGQLTRRLKRELAQSRHEADLAERALDHSDRNLSRLEARCSDESGYAAELESKAARLVAQSPAAQQHLEEEGEAESLRAQRRELLGEIRSLHPAGDENLEHARRLHSAAERWASAVGLSSGGASLLAALGFARTDAEDALLRLAKCGEEAASMAEQREATLLLLHTAQRRHRLEVASLATCETAMLTASAEHGTYKTEWATGHDAARLFADERCALLLQCRRCEEEIQADSADLGQLVELESSLTEEVLVAQHVRQRVVSAAPDLDQKIQALDAEMSRSVAERRSLHSEVLQDAAAQDARAATIRQEVHHLQGDLCQAEASNEALKELDEGSELRDIGCRSAVLTELLEADRLEASCSESASRCVELRSLLRQEQETTKDLRTTARQAFDETRAAEQQLMDLQGRQEAILAAAASDYRLAEDRGNRLREELVARDASQANLGRAIGEATQQVESLRRERDEALNEAAAVRRRNTSLRNLVSGGYASDG